MILVCLLFSSPPGRAWRGPKQTEGIREALPVCPPRMPSMPLFPFRPGGARSNIFVGKGKLTPSNSRQFKAQTRQDGQIFNPTQLRMANSKKSNLNRFTHPEHGYK